MSSALPIAYLNEHIVERSYVDALIAEYTIKNAEGVFTTLCVNNHQIECLFNHLVRLTQHCITIGFKAPLFNIASLKEMIRQNQAYHGRFRLRLIVFMNATLHQYMHIATVDQYQPSYSDLVRLIPEKSIILDDSAKLKKMNRLHVFPIRQRAMELGFDDFLLLDDKGIILETRIANIFWQVGDRIYTPDTSLPVLQGIMVSMIHQAIENLEMKMVYCQAKIEDIPEQAHIYVANSLIQCLPVTQIGNRFFNRNFTFEQQLGHTLHVVIKKNSEVVDKEKVERVN